MASCGHEFFNLTWTKLSGQFAAGVAVKWKKRVLDMYSEPQRYYHTLDHVEDMLKMKEEHCKDKLQQQSNVDYAIIFHDLVYQPKSSDNEAKSALLFSDLVKEAGIPIPVEQKVVEMIHATKSHQTAAHQSEVPGTEDLHFLLDLDMSILGRPKKGYQTYAQQIRQEYSHIPEDTYCQGRAEVLASFLKTPYIYATEEFRQRFEAQARKNIQAEIDNLNEKVNNLSNS